jgi:hypothetical protein
LKELANAPVIPGPIPVGNELPENCLLAHILCLLISKMNYILPTIN